MKRIIKTLNSVEEWTLVFVLLGLALLCFVQVICRYVFQFSFTWMEELSRYFGVFISFLGASLGVKYGTHFSMDFVYERVANDRFRHALKIVISVLAAVIFIIIAWYGWQQAMKLRRFGVLTSALQLPKYWAYLPIPFFSVIMSFRFARHAGKHLGKFVRGEPFRLSGDQP